MDQQNPVTGHEPGTAGSTPGGTHWREPHNPGEAYDGDTLDELDWLLYRIGAKTSPALPFERLDTPVGEGPQFFTCDLVVHDPEHDGPAFVLMHGEPHPARERADRALADLLGVPVYRVYGRATRLGAGDLVRWLAERHPAVLPSTEYVDRHHPPGYASRAAAGAVTRDGFDLTLTLHYGPFGPLQEYRRACIHTTPPKG